MIVKVTEADRKREIFVNKLKGKDFPRDSFSRAIQPGDIIIFGTGTQNAAGLNFGLVEKFNYKTGIDYQTKDKTKYVSSITVKVATVNNNKIILHNRRGLARFRAACILDFPPKEIIEVFEEWEASENN